jgi:[lysine-biosynthesis-protein LysW]--L-2-aminoadipate ligase
VSDVAADVLVSVTIVRPEERALLSSLRAAGLNARMATARQTAAVLNQSEPAPQAVLLRNVSHRELAGQSERFQQAGIRTINSPEAVRVCLAKDLQAIAFAKAGISHPVSRIAYTPDQVRGHIDALGGEAVIKPVSGSWGRGIVRIRDEDQFEAWLGGRESLDAGAKAFPVVVQEYVPKPGYNERVIVIGDGPVVAYRQVSDAFRTNTHLGGTVAPIPIAPRSRELALRVVDLLGPGIYGIDLAESAVTGELFVLEVNTNPDFANSSAVHGVPIPDLVAAYVQSAIGAGERRLELAGVSAA